MSLNVMSKNQVQNIKVKVSVLCRSMCNIVEADWQRTHNSNMCKFLNGIHFKISQLFSHLHVIKCDLDLQKKPPVIDSGNIQTKDSYLFDLRVFCLPSFALVTIMKIKAEHLECLHLTTYDHEEILIFTAKLKVNQK